MNLKEIMQKDMSIFYDTSEFGLSATFKDVELRIRFENEYEVESISSKVLSTPTTGVLDIKSGDKFIIQGTSYKCLNFELLESFKTKIVISKI